VGVADPDRRTVLLAISGDTGAFERLVRDNQAYVRALLRRSCGDAALAEDLTQTVFLKAWRQLKSLRDPDAFRGWLRRIAVNALVDAVRRGTIKAEQALDAESGLGQTSPELAIVNRLEVDQALARIGFSQRTCIVLAYGEGMSHVEIAAALEMPVGTVKSHIARGISAMRALMLEKEEQDD